MTGSFERPTTDEIEYVVPAGEPSHVHIPRPSRRAGAFIADDRLGPLEVLARCARGED